MNLVSLPRFNELRFAHDPLPMPKLWRWCREKKIPARKIGGEYFVDLDAFDRGETGQKPEEKPAPARVVQLVVDRLRKV